MHTVIVRATLQGMQWVLLVGAALNFAGAAKLLAGAAAALRAPAETKSREPTPPRAPAAAPQPRSGAAALDDHLQLQLFTAGTAAAFGALYAYLYAHPEHVDPFLIFGAALKTWALVLCAGLLAARRLTPRAFAEFGLSNGVVAALFWLYLATGA